MSKLTDEQKQDIHNKTGAGHSLICLIESYIEAAATEPLLQRIAELEQRNSDLHEDVQRFKKHALNEKAARLELERLLEEASKDAERYRWLVAQMMHPGADHQEEMFNRLHAINPDPANAKEVDAAIDAAMQKGQS